MGIFFTAIGVIALVVIVLPASIAWIFYVVARRRGRIGGIAMRNAPRAAGVSSASAESRPSMSALIAAGIDSAREAGRAAVEESASRKRIIDVQPPDRGTLLFALPFAGVGLVALIIGVWSLTFELAFERTAVHAPGSVVRIEMRRMKNRTYYPIVRFTDENGRSHEITGGVGRGRDAHHTGEVLGVMYPPGHPDEARMDDPTERWFVAAFGLGFALIFGGVGVASFLPYWRKETARRMVRKSSATVMARLEGTRQAKDFRKRPTWIVTALWTRAQDQQTYRFHSDPLPADPQGRLRPGMPLPLKIDADHPERFWMDIGGQTRS